MYDIDSNGSVDRQEMLKIIEVRLNFFERKQKSCSFFIVNL